MKKGSTRRISSLGVALFALVLTIAVTPTQSNAASTAKAKIGATCPSDGAKSTAGSVAVICTLNKVTGKLNWIPEKQTTVNLQIDGSAVPYYAPIYAAVDQGYFAQRGIKLNIGYASGADILKNVAAGNVEFGFPNGDSVVSAYGNGVLVNVVHTTYQKGIGAILFNKNTSKIKTAADLKGKKVAVTDLGSPNYIQLQVILKAVGLSLSDIKLVTIPTGSIVPALQSGEVDAIVFSRIRYYALKSAGFPVGQILSDSFLPSFGNIIVTNPTFRTKNREVVKGFIEAFNDGLKFSTRRPVDAVDGAISRYATGFAGQNAFITNVIRNVFVKDLWNSTFTRSSGYGFGNLEAWQNLIDTQAKFGIIPKAFDAKLMVIQPSDV